MHINKITSYFKAHRKVESRFKIVHFFIHTADIIWLMHMQHDDKLSCVEGYKRSFLHPHSTSIHFTSSKRAFDFGST